MKIDLHFIVFHCSTLNQGRVNIMATDNMVNHEVITFVVTVTWHGWEGASTEIPGIATRWHAPSWIHKPISPSHQAVASYFATEAWQQCCHLVAILQNGRHWHLQGELPDQQLMAPWVAGSGWREPGLQAGGLERFEGPPHARQSHEIHSLLIHWGSL